MLIGLTTLFCVACQDSERIENEKVIDPGELIGEWNNLSIRINIQSKNNLDTSEVFEVSRSEWEERLRIKPIRTFFRADSSWNSAHYNLKDSLVYNPSGKWWITENKLVMLQEFPSPDTTRYTMILKKDTVSFESLLDWDMDGKKDDLYFGRQIKVNDSKCSRSYCGSILKSGLFFSGQQYLHRFKFLCSGGRHEHLYFLSVIVNNLKCFPYVHVFT
jgi:hypothetical protein